MKVTRLSLLLMVVSIVMLAGIQESSSSTFTTAAWPHATGAVTKQLIGDATFSIPDPRTLLTGSPASDRSLLWKAQWAMYLVSHPELSRQQVRIIVEAISLSSSDNASPRQFGNLVAGKTEEDILKLYFDLSALPVKKRRVSFKNLSANDRSELWRTHLVLFLVKRPELSELQKDVILSAMSLATSEYFGVRSSDPLWKIKVREPSRSLERQIANAFTLEDATKIFATLGDDAELAQNSTTVLLKSINYKPLSDSGPYMQWANNSSSEQDLLVIANCGCSTDSDYCSIWSSCVGGSCTGSENGCGTLWSHPCNGACK